MNRVAAIGIIGATLFMKADRFHRGGETLSASAAHFETGGKGYNQAVAAARQGARVAFLAATAKENRERLTKEAESEGIAAYLAGKDGPATVAAVITNARGNTHVTVYRGAELTAGDVEGFRGEIEAADVLLLTNETPEEVNECAAKIATAAGTKIILDPAPARETSKAVAAAVWVFTPNASERSSVPESKSIVTLGGRGCFDGETGKSYPALKVRAVDATGAGDVFNGTLAAYVAADKGRDESIRAAIAASALSVTKEGAASSAPTTTDMIRFTAEYRNKNAKKRR